ncbi:MAG: hypothetical protein PHU70_02050 [Dehalococcoidia bacterium]|nr:hypothetical protein [Dehalococcoidia bacterium]
MRTHQIVFDETLEPLTGDTFKESCPFDGTIINVYFQYPAGCQSLVDVAVGHGSERCFPHKGYIALDDAHPAFDVEEAVPKGEEIWAEINNGDSAYDHRIIIILTIREGVSK